METWGVLRFIWMHPANRHRRVRQIWHAASFQAKGRLLRRPTITRIGSRSLLLVDLHRTAGSRAVYANPPDWPEMFVWQMRLRPDDLFVDVGANVGIYSVLAADIGASVIAVEPNQAAASVLQQNLAMNRANAEVYIAALSDRAGTVFFDSESDATGHISSHGVPVACQTLDELLGDRVAAGVKIDVEGAERLVLEGATRALQEQRLRCVQLEWNEQSLHLFGESRLPVQRLLQGNGYSLYRPDAFGVLRLLRGEVPLGSDVFAIPDNSMQIVEPREVATRE